MFSYLFVFNICDFDEYVVNIVMFKITKREIVECTKKAFFILDMMKRAFELNFIIIIASKFNYYRFNQYIK